MNFRTFFLAALVAVGMNVLSVPDVLAMKALGEIWKRVHGGAAPAIAEDDSLQVIQTDEGDKPVVVVQRDLVGEWRGMFKGGIVNWSDVNRVRTLIQSTSPDVLVAVARSMVNDVQDTSEDGFDHGGDHGQHTDDDTFVQLRGNFVREVIHRLIHYIPDNSQEAISTKVDLIVLFLQKIKGAKALDEVAQVFGDAGEILFAAADRPVDFMVLLIHRLQEESMVSVFRKNWVDDTILHRLARNASTWGVVAYVFKELKDEPVTLEAFLLLRNRTNLTAFQVALMEASFDEDANFGLLVSYFLKAAEASGCLERMLNCDELYTQSFKKSVQQAWSTLCEFALKVGLDIEAERVRRSYQIM